VARRVRRAHGFDLDLVSLGWRLSCSNYQQPGEMAPGSGKRQGASKKAKQDASLVCLVPVEENDPALACTQAEEKPTIALKLADANRELANAKLNATTAANEAKKQMTDQKKQAAVEVSELKGRNKVLPPGPLSVWCTTCPFGPQNERPPVAWWSLPVSSKNRRRRCPHIATMSACIERQYLW
jgi:hypothetical protein